MAMASLRSMPSSSSRTRRCTRAGFGDLDCLANRCVGCSGQPQIDVETILDVAVRLSKRLAASHRLSILAARC